MKLTFSKQFHRARSIRPNFPEKFWFKIEWNRKFLENRFENFGPPHEVVLFSGNLEIPESSCSIWHFYPVGICSSSFSREKLQDSSESFESTRYDLIFREIVVWSFQIS